MCQTSEEKTHKNQTKKNDTVKLIYERYLTNPHIACSHKLCNFNFSKKWVLSMKMNDKNIELL